MQNQDPTALFEEFKRILLKKSVETEARNVQKFKELLQGQESLAKIVKEKIKDDRIKAAREEYVSSEQFPKAHLVKNLFNPHIK